jgi:DnaJ-class molecular chaperone
MKMEDMSEIMVDPEKYGYKQCPHCNGYGSSLKDPEGVDTCTVCHGWGLVKEDDKEKPPQLNSTAGH